MFQNTSPWLFQLNRSRPVSLLLDDAKTDIAIVGGGIAGVVSAYYILKNTKKDVMLVEGHKVAHGATGHNAGQLASYFERPFSDIVEEFGLPLAADAQMAVNGAWELLEKIYKEAKLETPMQTFTGYAGCGTLESILIHLKDIAYQKQAGIVAETMLIAKEAKCLKDIPKEFKDCYSLVPHKDILSLLETDNKHFIATLLKQKGCLNSALFTEELAGYLLAQYPDRFTLHEHAPVSQVILREKTALLDIEGKFVLAERVVLCTNGFERLNIINTSSSADINTKFHDMVLGAVGYMAGYLEERNQPPVAISYLPDHLEDPTDIQQAESYFYLTRRPFESEKNESHNLICLGGPESLMDDTNDYKKEHPYPEEAQTAIDTFLRKNYKFSPKKKIQYKFKWHGLMGYTANGIRCVGVEPCNSVLLYNLGCNGVGILPSIAGGERIGRILAGEKLKKSIFDPHNGTCKITQTFHPRKRRRKM